MPNVKIDYNLSMTISILIHPIKDSIFKLCYLLNVSIPSPSFKYRYFAKPLLSITHYYLIVTLIDQLEIYHDRDQHLYEVEIPRLCDRDQDTSSLDN